MIDDDFGWEKYQQLVLAELSRLSSEIHEIKNSLRDIHIHIAELRVKSSIYGIVAGAITSVSIILLRKLFP